MSATGIEPERTEQTPSEQGKTFWYNVDLRNHLSTLGGVTPWQSQVAEARVV